MKASARVERPAKKDEVARSAGVARATPASSRATPARSGQVSRKTKETDVEIALALGVPETEIENEIAEGKLVTVLDDFAAPPNGIHALFPQRRLLPSRRRETGREAHCQDTATNCEASAAQRANSRSAWGKTPRGGQCLCSKTLKTSD